MTEVHLSESQLELIFQRRMEGKGEHEISRELGIPRSSFRRGEARTLNYPTPYEPNLYSNAECLRYKPDLFEYDPDAHPDRSMQEWTARLERAVLICEGCPIMIMCGNLATVNERTWTVRGGVDPYEYQLDVRRQSKAVLN